MGTLNSVSCLLWPRLFPFGCPECAMSDEEAGPLFLYVRGERTYTCSRCKNTYRITSSGEAFHWDVVPKNNYATQYGTVRFSIGPCNTCGSARSDYTRYGVGEEGMDWSVCRKCAPSQHVRKGVWDKFRTDFAHTWRVLKRCYIPEKFSYGCPRCIFGSTGETAAQIQFTIPLAVNYHCAKCDQSWYVQIREEGGYVWEPVRQRITQTPSPPIRDTAFDDPRYRIEDCAKCNGRLSVYRRMWQAHPDARECRKCETGGDLRTEKGTGTVGQ